MKVPADVAVPPTVVALTVTAPLPAGATAVIWVAELTVKLVAAVPPNFTAVAPVKFVPVMVTLVPPVAGPDVGARPVIVGAGTKVKVPTEVPVPPPVVTLTVTEPLPAAVTAVIWVAELTVKLAACGAAETDRRGAGQVRAGDDDLSATGRRAGRRREAGDGRCRDVGEGAGRRARCRRRWSTLTVTAPLPAGATAVIWVAELTVKLVAAVPPNVTAVAPVKSVPVMVTAGAAGSRAGRRGEAGDRRRRDVGEGAGRGAGAAAGRDADRHRAAAGGGDRGDLGRRVDREAGRCGAAERDRRGAGEVRCR